MTSLHRSHILGRIFVRRAGGLGRVWLMTLVLLWTLAMSASAQTPPGPTTIACPYATTNPATCWVSGDFVATVTPADPSYQGQPLTSYELCRSEDRDDDLFSGCQQAISLDAGTSYTVSGSHLPGDGSRRSYRFRPYYGGAPSQAWSAPRYVRIDRYDPNVAATGASTTWQTSAQATISAHDATGNAVSNSGIDAVRYSWNSPLNAACTNGTSTSHGATLNAPEGDNILYLCARDKVGRVDTWNGVYRVESTPPSPPGPTTIACPHATTNPNTCWVGGDFVATITPAEPTYAGANLLHYRFCRSNDESSDGPTGCATTIRFDAATSQTVSGADLPSTGNRRSYWFRAIYSNGYAGPWNTPRYVRLDAFDPVVVATGSSNDWQTSAQATITARDITGNAAANSGIHQVRYSWNNPLNASCSNGALTSHGAVLNAPEGDNILYLCTRDNVGRVDTWNGPFRVDSSSPTPPGPTTIACAHATTNPNTCWVTGDFVATVTPAGDGAGGSTITGYELCRSQDREIDTFSGCEHPISLDAGTSYTVSGSDLPSDGNRRSYWWRAYYNGQHSDTWNVPRYVRIDRYDPRVSATNASQQWFTSRSLTLSADDAGGPGGAAHNTGLVEARYSWNVPTNAGCTNGTVYTQGQTLNVPEGDNTLYLCGRDVTGRVGTWSDTYRVDNSIPVLDSLTISDNAWSVGNSTTYQITAQSTDTGAGVRELWVTINRDGDNSANPRGQFSWRDNSLGYLWGGDQVPCQGGGFASKRLNLFGPEHTTLVGCTTSVTGGGQRTVVFTVRPETSFGAHTANDISLFSRDFLLNRTPWQNYDLNFVSVVLGPPVLMVLDGNNALEQHEDVPWGTVEGGQGDIPRELVVRNAAPTGSSPLVLERGPGLSNIALSGSSAFSLSGTLDPLIHPQHEDTFSVVLDTSQSGTHNAFLYIWHNHVGRPNPLTIDLTATVESNQPPVIDSVNPWKITPGGVRTVTLHGQNFDDATVMIPTDPYDGNQPPRVFPTVTGYNVNSAGTQITATIDTSAAGVDGVYNLLVQTPCQDCFDSIDLRVAPANTPVVDMYTPSEVAVGRVFPVVLTGANLQNSTLTATHPGVKVLDVDSTDDEMISGALSVPFGVDPGDFDIEIFTPGQGFTTVPVKFLLEGEPGTKANHAVISEEKVAEARAAGTEMPDIYIQEPTVSPSLLQRITSGEESPDKIVACTFTFNRRLINFTRVLIIPLDGLGNINHQVLSSVGLGSTVQFGAITISLFADITFRFSFDACSFSDFGICIIGRIGFEVIGLDGIIVNFSFCFPVGGASSTADTTGGSLTRLELTSPGNCSTVTQTTNPTGGGVPYVNGSSGAHFADFTLNGCCDEPVEVSLTVSTFNNVPFFGVTNFTGAADFLQPQSPACGPCNVTLDPLPKCLLKSNSRTLSATGQPAGGQYSWTLPEGGNSVQFDSGTTADTVTLLANEASTNVDDVRVRVTYTAPGGISCFAEDRLTAIEFEPFVFKALLGQSASTHNEARNNLPLFGFPALGWQDTFFINDEGVPFRNHTKNVELGVALKPCKANLQCNFDIFRERQGRVYELEGNILRINRKHDCPAPMWCNDDADFSDEDLTVNNNSCSIYSLDGPGLSSPETCTAEGAVNINCLNFREKVLFDEGVSDIFEWSAFTQTKCTQGQFELFGINQINNALYPNCPNPPSASLIAKTGEELVLAQPLNVAASATAIVENLKSEDRSAREGAYLAASPSHRKAALTKEEESILIDELILMAQERSASLPFESTPLLAIRLLGELEAKEAIPVLIERINIPFPMFIVSPADRIPPATQALIQIGDASANAILDQFEDATDAEWERMRFVLDRLDPKVVEMGVYPRLTKDDGSVGQERLRALLTD